MPALQPGSSSRQSLAVTLARAFPHNALPRGEAYVDSVDARIDPLGGVVGSVLGSRANPYEIRMMPSLSDPRVLLAACSCPAAEVDPCKHMWAMLRVIDRRHAWPHEVPLPTKLELTVVDDPDLELIADDDSVAFSTGDGTPDAGVRGQSKPAARRFSTPSPPSWRERLGPWPHSLPLPSSKPAYVEYVLEAQRLVTLSSSRRVSAPLDERGCTLLVATTTYTKAALNKPAKIRRKLGRVDQARLGSVDREVHAVLFGIEDVFEHGWASSSRYYYSSGSRSGVRIAAERVAEVLPRISATGRLGWLPDPDGALAVLAWDDRGAWELEVRVAGASDGRVRATGWLVRGDEQISLDAVTAVGGAGVVIVDDRMLAVATDGLARWSRLLAGGVELPAQELSSFLEATSQPVLPPRFELSALGWQVANTPLVKKIVVERRGRTGFEARAELAYGDEQVKPGGRAVIIDGRARRLLQRSAAGEAAAALTLRELGGTLERPWSVPGPSLRALTERAATAGWEVWYDGGRVRTSGAFSAQVTTGIDWFDVTIDLQDGDANASMPELIAALQGGRPLVRLSDGTLAMIPSWLEARARALGTAPLVDGALRFRPAEALIVASLVDRFPEAQVDEGFARLRERLENFTGLEPRSAPRGFGATLRDYQRDGLGWLWFLRNLGLGGCLADDMGLGKTVQVLALLDGLRTVRRATRKPSLVVAPKSLVFHWLDEARRFAPKLRTLEWHGAGRAKQAAQLAQVDLVVTTYATLRQDLDQLAKLELDVVVLDEAHAIKTASTETAKATRALNADHRLALTGTPVENRLDDLASIFEFLNPGLLGRPAALRAIATAETEGSDPEAIDRSRARALGTVLRPFLLRRTKHDVLTELPSKTEQIIGCRLENAERKRYDELRLHYRRALLPAVERDGVGKNAIMVLEALLRLRQASLHPGLLDPKRTTDDSAKLDALLEHLNEVIASGHRALVFSQFTSMLAIIRTRLDRNQIAYEYLDGKTTDRRERVAAFQAGGASVFLLSLKVGGTGLNLTAADHVFLFDPWWNPAVETQAIDRVHRIGQSRPVTAYRLVAEDTVEQKILALQDRKRALFDSVFEDKGVVARLTATDLRALLD